MNNSHTYSSDDNFDLIYPASVRKYANRHWTPLKVAMEAAEFLAPSAGARILDIGSGIGKFCLAAAHSRPLSSFYGIEQRVDLVDIAERARLKLELHNVGFEKGNFTSLDFSRFTGFYFYNSFFENITTGKIDYKVDHSLDLYNRYNLNLFRQLDKCPDGTRLATFHSLENEIPPSYYTVKSDAEGQLKFWIKTTV